MNDDDSSEIYFQIMDEINDRDLFHSLGAGQVLAIVDETCGGIIGYALGAEHARSIVDALRGVAS